METVTKPKIFVVTGSPRAYDGHLVVEPKTVSEKYCAVINVADSPCATFDFQMHIPSFWFPINEIGLWGFSPFFGAVRVVQQYYKGDKPVLIHCHAGANRSPSVAFAILLAKGYTVQEAEASLEYEGLNELFQRNVLRKHIPTNIIEFLQEAETNGDSLHYCLARMSALRDEIAQKRYDEGLQPTSPGEIPTLVYDKVTKRFVITK